MTLGIASALHVLSAVTWIGGMLFVILVLRPTLPGLPAETRMPFFAQILKRFFVLVWLAVVTILVSGYLLVSGLFGGFASAPLYVHFMHAIGLLMAALYVYLFFVVYTPFKKAVAGAQPEAVQPLAERMRKIVTMNLILGVIVVVIATAGRYIV